MKICIENKEILISKKRIESLETKAIHYYELYKNIRLHLSLSALKCQTTFGILFYNTTRRHHLNKACLIDCHVNNITCPGRGIKVCFI